MYVPASTVTERVEGTRRILESGGWELTIGEEFQTSEPLIADEVIAKHLGVEVESVRRLIRRHAAPQTPDTASGVSGEPNIVPVPYTRTVRRMTRGGQNRGEITVHGFMLTEADALFVVTRSDSPRAIAFTKKMIAVYMAVRRHLAATVPVKGHARKLPGMKALPAPAPVRYVPLASRIATPTRTDDGVERWEITLQLRTTAARMLVDMAQRNGWTAEECAETALMGWTCTAASLGFSAAVQR